MQDKLWLALLVVVSVVSLVPELSSLATQLYASYAVSLILTSIAVSVVGGSMGRYDIALVGVSVTGVQVIVFLFKHLVVF